jgi:deoxyribodipyrimidine photo-lyase
MYQDALLIRPRFPTDYDAILDRVRGVDAVAYAKTRNYLDGAVSYLSPYITHGVLPLPRVRDMVLEDYTLKQANNFIFELTWREFFHRVYWELGDGIWRDIKREQPDVRTDRIPAAIVDAQTGIDVLDDAIRGLYETGYMHNHARMWVASVTCNVAGSHWYLPSKWLYYHLLDGDLASNTLSWQWVAGAFSNKKYYANQGNLNKYSGRRVKPQKGTIIDLSYEELRERMYDDPEILADKTEPELRTPLPATDTPRLDPDRPVLLYHAWSLDPEWYTNLDDAQRVLVLEPSHFNDYPISVKRVKFILKLAENIPGLQTFVGEVDDLPGIHDAEDVRRKPHPATTHFPGIADDIEWLFPQMPQRMYNSFFSYWKKAEKFLEG